MVIALFLLGGGMENKIKIRCSKCGSDRIVKPANDDLVFELKCLDCGHEKKKDHRNSLPRFYTSITSIYNWNTF